LVARDFEIIRPISFSAVAAPLTCNGFSFSNYGQQYIR
jgi:hypothetical protein